MKKLKPVNCFALFFPSAMCLFICFISRTGVYIKLDYHTHSLYAIASVASFFLLYLFVLSFTTLNLHSNFLSVLSLKNTVQVKSSPATNHVFFTNFLFTTINFYVQIGYIDVSTIRCTNEIA